MGKYQHAGLKRDRFVEEYLVDLCAAKAAIRAGYSGKTAKVIGNQLLKLPEVQDAIRAKQAARSEAVAISAENVLKVLWENGFLARGAEDYAASNAAFKLVGEHIDKSWRDKPAVNVHVNLDALTDAQLAHLANGGDLGDLPRD